MIYLPQPGANVKTAAAKVEAAEGISERRKFFVIY
jgi:hypothetical protein